MPHVKTVLGVSNISFGLPAAAREVVNSVFLYYCTKAGLDLAIVNAEKLERFASIPAEDRALAENLLFNTPPVDVPADHPHAELRTPEDWRQQSREQKAAVNQHHIAAIAEHFRGRTGKVKAANRPSSRSTSGSPTTSSKASRTVWSRIWTRKLAEGRRRSTSSTDL